MLIISNAVHNYAYHKQCWMHNFTFHKPLNYYALHNYAYHK